MAYGGKYGSDDSKALIEKRLDHGREVGGRKLKAVKQQHDRAGVTIVRVSVVVRDIELMMGETDVQIHGKSAIMTVEKRMTLITR